MKLNDYVRLVFINIKSTKMASVLFLIVSIVILFLGNVFININPNYSAYVEKVFKEDVDMRTILVYKEGLDYESTINDVLKINNVVFSYNQQFNYMNVKLDIISNNELGLNIKPATNTFSPTIIMGRKLKDFDEMICPLYLGKVSEPKTREHLISMKKYLNKYVNISYNSYEIDDIRSPKVNKSFNKTIKIVGLYDNVLSSESYNECYMLSEELIKMVDESQDVYTENFLKDNVVQNTGVFTNVILDDVENLGVVRLELEEKGYVTTEGASFDTSFFNKLKNISYTGLIIVLALLLFVFLIFISSVVKNTKNSIALYKLFGFREKDLIFIMSFQVVFLTCLAYIISLLFLLVSVGILNSIISNYINYSCLSIFISLFHEVIYMLFILVFIVISSYYISRSVSKLQIRRILADGN